MADNTTDYNFECSICFKKIASKGSLTRHMQTIHETRQLFPCTVCHLTFKRRYDLSRHTRIHDVSQQFLCDLCGHAFARKDNMNLHRKQIHGFVKGQGQGHVKGHTVGQDDTMMNIRKESEPEEGTDPHSCPDEHFVGGRGPTAEHPDPIPYNPTTVGNQQSVHQALPIQGDLHVGSPEVDIPDIKPQLSQLQRDLASVPHIPASIGHPGIHTASSPQFRPTFAQRGARAQQVRHAGPGRPGVVGRPPAQISSSPSATATSASSAPPPIKRPRIEAPRPMAQAVRHVVPAQRQMGNFSQSNQVASRNTLNSPPRQISQTFSRPSLLQRSPQHTQTRPMVQNAPRTQMRPQVKTVHVQQKPLNVVYSKSTPMTESQPKSILGQQSKSNTERAFLNPDHSSHIMTELSALWKSGKFVDAAILVGGMKLQAHRMVLFAASPFLRTSFDHLNPTTELRLKMPPDIKLDIVFQFLTYIYDGILKLNPSNVVPLLRISLMLHMEHLTYCCREYMSIAIKRGTMSDVGDQDVQTPLLVLVDQKPADNGQTKSDMCTQTISDSSSEAPPAIPKVNFERVFGDTAPSNGQSLKSDINLFQNYGDNATTSTETASNEEEDEGDATPMMIIKNEYIDPEYELSINADHDAEEDEQPPPDDKTHVKQSSEVTDPGGIEPMQVMPGIDLDNSSPSTSLPDDDHTTNDAIDNNLETTLDPRQNVHNADMDCDPSTDISLEPGGAGNISQTDDKSETVTVLIGGDISRTLSSGPDTLQTHDDDDSTPQFGTEQFLTSDFDNLKSENKDPV